jgi:hypothetical protein
MKKVIGILLFAAGILLLGCDTFQFAQKSMCQECLAEAKTRSNMIATTLLSTKNPTVKMDGEVLVIGAKDEVLNIACSGDTGCIVQTTRKKSDGTMSAPHKASAKELEYLYCPKALKKYNTPAK